MVAKFSSRGAAPHAHPVGALPRAPQTPGLQVVSDPPPFSLTSTDSCEVCEQMWYMQVVVAMYLVLVSEVYSMMF